MTLPTITSPTALPMNSSAPWRPSTVSPSGREPPLSALKGKSRNIRESGREVSADYIVEESILRAGDTLRINAQLIRVRDNFSLWSGRFERNVSDILSVQDGIARAIAGNLPIKLERQRKRSEVNPEAYDLYLKARAAGLHDSAGLFQDSIAKDPSFAPAYAGLAEA